MMTLPKASVRSRWPWTYRRKRRSRAARIRRRCLFGGMAVVAAGGIWLVVTGMLARHELNAVRSELPQLRAALGSGNFGGAVSVAGDLRAHAKRAHGYTSGPAWFVAAEIPWLGRPARTARTIAAQGDIVGRDVLPGVISLTHDLTSASLRQGPNIQLAPIIKAAPVLQSSAIAATNAADAVAASPHHTWLPAIDSARATVGSDLADLRNELVGASRATQILPAMLGATGPKRYFLGFENEAEARGLGGLPGAFAIVTADHGKVSVDRFEDDGALAGVQAAVNLGPDYAARYGQDDPTGIYVNSNVSPNFPDAAQIWAAMWQNKTGQPLDGAVAVDPTALSYLLAVTGPATLPDGEQVDAGNVLALTQKDVYARFDAAASSGAAGLNAANAARKQYLKSVAAAVSQKLLGSGATTQLVRAAARAADERRLLVWSADPSTQTLLAASGYAGTAQDDGAPVTGFVVNNAAGTKLDYYLDRRMSYRRADCGSSAQTVASFTVTNGAPASGLPAYVTNRADTPPRSAKPGDSRALVTYYGTPGSTVESVTVDGKPMITAPVKENGLLTLTLDLELARGASHTIAVSLREPANSLPVVVLRQPLVAPMRVEIDDDNHCT